MIDRVSDGLCYNIIAPQQYKKRESKRSKKYQGEENDEKTRCVLKQTSFTTTAVTRNIFLTGRTCRQEEVNEIELSAFNISVATNTDNANVCTYTSTKER